MAPGVLSDNVSTQDTKPNTHAREPLQPTGILDKFDFEEVTPIIGREFPHVNIVDDLLNASNADDLLRELAVTSTITLPTPPPPSPLTIIQSPVAVSSSSAPKTTLPTTSKSS
jgi:hypothetical protein